MVKEGGIVRKHIDLSTDSGGLQRYGEKTFGSEDSFTCLCALWKVMKDVIRVSLKAHGEMCDQKICSTSP